MSVGIATFSALVESSPNRIACDIWGRPSCLPVPSTLVRCGAWCPAMSFCCRGCSICFPGPCPSGPIGIGYAHPDRLLSYPDVRYLSGCDGIRGASAPFSRTSPHFGLLLSGVTPLRWVLHHFGGGVMLPNWCNAPSLVHDLQDPAAMSPSGTRR